MPAKRKAPKVNWHARAELAGRSALEAIRENAGLRGQLDELARLREELKMKELQLENAYGNIRELAAEMDWWRGQAADYQSELLAMVRDEARRAKPVVDKS